MDEETIKKAAYEIWERQGKPNGQDFEHWLQAKDELDESSSDQLPGSISAEATPPTSPQPPATKASKPTKSTM
jgi:ribosomal protein S17E